MRKSILALLLALCLILGLMAGCGSQNSSGADATESAGAEIDQQEAPETVAEEGPEADTSSAAEADAVAAELPAYEANEEQMEVSLLFQYPGFFQGFFPSGWASSPWWEAFGEATNTTWTLREVANTAWQENVNLLCASGDLPDLVCNLGSVYSGGLAQAIRDEQILDVAPMLEENAPYYLQKLAADDYTLKVTLTDDGEMGAMYPLLKEPYPVTNGLWIRQDWLTELDMEIPATPEEMMDVLVAFRDEFGADVGFYQMIRSNTGTAGVAAEGIWNAFGPTDFFLDEDGTVQYGPMQDYYYDYLQYLKDLASEDLFLTSEMTDKTSSELFASGGIGIEGDSPDNVPAYIVLLPKEEQEKIELVPMAALGEPTEYMNRESYISGDAGGNVSVSTNCGEPEAVIHALDYLFTEEGALLSSYGIEGTSFTYNDAGEPELTELVLSNPDGIPSRAAMGYWMNPGLPGMIDYARSHTTWDEVQKSAFDVWESAYTGDSMTLPTDYLTLTEDEQDEISVYKSDMVTYVTQWVNEVIFGDKELTDDLISEFQSTMNDTMHVQEMLDIYNDAYQRFQERSFG